MYITIGFIVATLICGVAIIAPWIPRYRKLLAEGDFEGIVWIELLILSDQGKLYFGEKLELFARFVLYLFYMSIIHAIITAVWPGAILFLFIVAVMYYKREAAIQRREEGRN